MYTDRTSEKEDESESDRWLCVWEGCRTNQPLDDPAQYTQAASLCSHQNYLVQLLTRRLLFVPKFVGYKVFLICTKYKDY